jgi:outer membrane receptor for ferrienterochelin and colicins
LKLAFKSSATENPEINLLFMLHTHLATKPTLTLLALLLCQPGFAQVGAEASDPGLPTVTIRANRQTLQERFDAPGSRVIVGRDDIEQMGADTVSDVLRQLPGVMATTTADGRTEIRMRGMDRSATQILVDGERTSNGRRGGQLPFDQIPSELIERIEVIRSPSPEFSGASAGTINIVLKQGTVQRETNARITNQFFDDRNAGQVFFSRTGPLSELTPEQIALPPEQRPIPTTYFLLISAYERLGATNRLANTSNSNSSEFDTKSDHSRSRTREAMLIPRFTVKPNFKDTWTINPFLIVTNSTSTVDGLTTGQSIASGGTPFGYSINSSELTTTDRALARLSTTWAHRFTSNRLETRASMERGTEKTVRVSEFSTQSPSIASGRLTPGVTNQTLTDERAETVFNLATKLQGFADAKVWSLGGEIDHRVLDADTITSGTSVPVSTLDYRAKQLRLAAWGQNEWIPFAKATLVGGLRLESLSRNTTSSTFGRSDDWLRWQPSLNLRTPISPDVQFRAGIARTTKIPPLLDVVDRTVLSSGINSATRPDTKGNTALRPETTLSFDVGFEFKLAAGSVATSQPSGQRGTTGPGGAGGGQRGGQSTQLAQVGQAGFNVFVRDIQDPIIRTTSFDSAASAARPFGAWVQTPQNGQNGRAWGIETDIKLPLSVIGLNAWNFTGNASVFRSNIDLGGGNFGRIPGQPYYIANMSVTKPIPRAGGFFAGATLNLTGATKLGDGNNSGGQSGHVARLDGFIGQVIPGVGYLRLGVFNLNNAGRDRVRTDTDAVTGNTRSEQVVERGGRSVFLTFGTRF